MLNTLKPSKAQEEVTNFCHAMFDGEVVADGDCSPPLFPVFFDFMGWSVRAVRLPQGRRWLAPSSVMMAKRIDARLSSARELREGEHWYEIFRLILGRWSFDLERKCKSISVGNASAQVCGAHERPPVEPQEPASLWVGGRNFCWTRLEQGRTWHSSGDRPGEAVAFELSCSLYDGGPLQSDFLIRRLIAGRWNVCTQVAV